MPLDDPLVDLHAVLDVLTADLIAAVPGYLGLTVAVQVGEHPVVINTLNIDDAQDAAATLMLPLAPMQHACATGSVVFYSRTAAAFRAHRRRCAVDPQPPRHLVQSCWIARRG